MNIPYVIDNQWDKVAHVLNAVVWEQGVSRATQRFAEQQRHRAASAEAAMAPPCEGEACLPSQGE